MNGRPVSGSFNEEWSTYSCAAPPVGHSDIIELYISTISNEIGRLPGFQGGYLFSRVRGGSQIRPDDTVDGNRREPFFTYSSVGYPDEVGRYQGIVNGDFGRGPTGAGENDFPGWESHGGVWNAHRESEGFFGNRFARLYFSSVGGADPGRVLDYIASDRFYVPENATGFGFWWKVEDPGTASNAQLQVFVGSGEPNGLQGIAVYPATSESGWQYEPVSLGPSCSPGSVCRIAFRVTGGEYMPEVWLDDIQIRTGTEPPPPSPPQLTSAVVPDVISEGNDFEVAVRYQSQSSDTPEVVAEIGDGASTVAVPLDPEGQNWSSGVRFSQLVNAGDLGLAVGTYPVLFRATVGSETIELAGGTLEVQEAATGWDLVAQNATYSTTAIRPNVDVDVTFQVFNAGIYLSLIHI